MIIPKVCRRETVSILTSVLQFSNDPVAFAEWFAASVAFIVIVTLIYVFVLRRTRPLEAVTVEKIEKGESQSAETRSQEAGLALQNAQQSLQTSDLGRAVQESVHAVELLLLGLVPEAPKDMNISDLAYLIQGRGSSSNVQFAPSLYQLNSLRLEVLRGKIPTREEASWAVSVANWTAEMVAQGTIK